MRNPDYGIPETGLPDIGKGPFDKRPIQRPDVEVIINVKVVVPDHELIPKSRKIYGQGDE
jgi:hypothetical protein